MTFFGTTNNVLEIAQWHRDFHVNAPCRTMLSHTYSIAYNYIALQYTMKSYYIAPSVVKGCGDVLLLTQTVDLSLAAVFPASSNVIDLHSRWVPCQQMMMIFPVTDNHSPVWPEQVCACVLRYCAWQKILSKITDTVSKLLKPELNLLIWIAIPNNSNPPFFDAKKPQHNFSAIAKVCMIRKVSARGRFSSVQTQHPLRFYTDFRTESTEARAACRGNIIETMTR